MKKIFILLVISALVAGCTKSTIKKYGCSDPPLTGSICLPNIFTPNGDGINDVLYIRQSPGLPQVASMEFRILDGTGAILFYSADTSRGWDGSYNGKTKAGVYTCEVSATLTNSQLVDFSGTITCLTDVPSEYIISSCADCRFNSQFNGNGSFDAALPTGESNAACE